MERGAHTACQDSSSKYHPLIVSCLEVAVKYAGSHIGRRQRKGQLSCGMWDSAKHTARASAMSYSNQWMDLDVRCQLFSRETFPCFLMHLCTQLLSDLQHCPPSFSPLTTGKQILQLKIHHTLELKSHIKIEYMRCWIKLMVSLACLLGEGSEIFAMYLSDF